MSTIAIRYFSR